MRAAVLSRPGVPDYTEFDPPTAVPGHTVVRVTAAGLNPFDVARAAGRIPELRGPYPAVAGHEGVGTVRGRRIYFGRTRSPYGSMAEFALVPDDALVELDPVLPDALAVALGTSGVAAWLALVSRARLAAGETVLVLGATGVVGTLTVQLARILGAGRVVADGRDPTAPARTLDPGGEAKVELSA
ncbi:MAG: alcohol dehydrogenase catalytic domain-containing protein, partial [Propionibacteriaceae bacterium]